MASTVFVDVFKRGTLYRVKKAKSTIFKKKFSTPACIVMMPIKPLTKIVKIIVKYIVYLAVFEALYLVVGGDDKYVHVVNMSPGNLLQLVVRRLSTNLHI